MKLSFIIIEYYSLGESYESCASIRDLISPELNYEIVISSNSIYSKEEQKKILAESEGVKWVFNARNGGFAYAMNEGLKAATGDVLIAMNPDVKLKSGLVGMIDYLLSDASIGLIAPRIENAAGVVQDSYRDFITPMRFLKRHFSRLLHEKKHYETESILQVDWVIGAFMAMTRKAYETVGGFDDAYFLYCEDMDLCKRMHLEGYSVVYYPHAVIEYEGTRSARRSWKYARIFLKSLFRYWGKFGKRENLHKITSE